ncbi:MAG: DUF3450 domain-containing protein [Leptolyngbyaceae cyanobacterium RM2_2_21]|nr:DUF3450 domain-containing protein [Leptolyngbyaceae cyanobacterium RM2_2_21]
MAETHLEELAREVLELKLAALSETNAAEKSVRQLQRQLGRLRAILLLAFILFGGVITWQVSSWRAQQGQIAQMQTQLAAIDTTQPERVQQLIEEIADLQQQVPNNLSTLLERNQQDIQTLQSTLSDLNETVGDRQRALVVLTQALQDILTDSTVPLLNPAPVPQAEAVDEAESTKLITA